MKISSLRWSPENPGKYWDKRAQEVGKITNAPSSGYYLRSEERIIRRFFSNISGKKILKLDLWNEVNNTQILAQLARQGAKIYGLDISPHLTLAARRNFQKLGLSAHFVNCDMRDMQFKDNFFDYVYSMGTIEHVPDYDKAISEIYRVLKPHGKAIIGVPNKLDPFLRPLLVWFLTKLGKYPYAPEKSFTIGELEKEAKKAGFKHCDRSGILFMPGFLRIIDVVVYKRFPYLSRLVGIILRPFEFLENKYPFLARNGYLIAVVGQK